MIGLFLAAALAITPYQATVVRVVDGDTVLVEVPAWAATPFHRMSVRVVGIDTPERRRPPAKCAAEVKLGLAASAFAHTLVEPGAAVTIGYVGLDKYGGRIDATLTLPDGRDWGATMIAQGLARPYGLNGNLHKSSWCKASPAP